MTAILIALSAWLCAGLALSYATSIRTARQAAIETDVGPSPVLRIYSGTVPADIGTALGAQVLLAEGTLPSDWATEASSVLTKAGTWTLTGQSGAGSGTAGTFFRIYASDGTTAKIQGTFGGPGSGKEMLADNASIADGQSITITSFAITEGNA